MNPDPAGPLAGATRIRPDGWLATPLDTDPTTAAAQAQDLISRFHPHARGPLRCLRAGYRTAVFTLGDPPVAVLKRHGDPDAYTGETLAYELLAGQNVLPGLRSACDTSHTLLVDHVARPANWSRPTTFDALVTAIATVHTASARWPPSLVTATACWQLDTALTAPPPRWISNPDAWCMLLHVTADAHGPAHIPLGHLDLKPAHLRADDDTTVRIIDVETLRPDLTGMPDLITLPSVAHAAGLDLDPRWIRRAYLAATTDRGARWNDQSLIRALTAFATATGLSSLHGLTAP
ncbi:MULTISPECIES: hypothetical protein [Protofrankia]|uniref:Aminoglycoside phosphotransferase domain-containing protein n=1 Tax=Protofrankia coriariae TaxID=1562887 RepID=A0ABR5F1I5_9ACTN|nr:MULTISPECIES: hypothetical protein [Protofrankia]KLL10581.1 hypothetical protein FrCorBMG51_17090 [Protofrankia coriariae]ONH34147.1 hypothetical protein BL254_17710 [Protofrankia sp. BMG5.30]